MGIKRNIGNDSSVVGAVFGLIMSIGMFVGFVYFTGYLIASTPKYCLMLKEKTYPEIVKSITYQHSFLDGDYCIIATDKDVHTESHTSTCVKNKVGSKLIIASWENGVCEE